MVFLASSALSISTFQLLRRSSSGDKAVTFWGLLSLGVFGGFSALGTSGVVLPEFSSQILFAIAGLLLSISLSRKPRMFNQASKHTRPIVFLVFFMILLLLTVGLFSYSAAFPLLMLAGYSPLLFVVARPLVIKDMRHAILIGSFGLYVVVAILALTIPDQFFGLCRLDKCSVWGQTIGNFSSGNAFGLILSGVGILLFSFGSSTLFRGLVALGSAILIDASSGRTSLLAFLATVVLLTLIRIIGNTRLRKNFIIAMVVLGSFVFVLIPFSPEAFTFRGQLWIYAKNMIPEEMWFGYGASDWVRSANSSGINLNYSTHNIWLEALYVSGIVGFLVFLVTLTVSKTLWGWDIGHPQIGIFLWIVIAGTTEVPAFVARPYIFPAVLLIYYLVALSVDNAENRDSGLGLVSKKPSEFRIS